MDHNRGVIGNIAQHPKSFSAMFVVFFVLALVFLAAVDALPDAPGTGSQKNVQQQEKEVALSNTDTANTSPEKPVRVVAKEVGLDVAVNNPTSTNVDVLDESLLSGSARYPTSALLGQAGTVLLFGHSSYLPIVHNQAYKAFDGIQNLKSGDIVSVYSGTTEYRYSVVSVKLADATEDVVELSQTGKHLTLVTCDSFTKKTDRFIVTADFVGAYSLTSN